MEKDKRSGKLAFKTILLLVLLGICITLSGSLLAFLQFRQNIRSIFIDEVYQIGDLIQDYLEPDTLEHYFSQMKEAQSEEAYYEIGDEYLNSSYDEIQHFLEEIHDSFVLDQIYIAALGKESEPDFFDLFLYAGVLEFDEQSISIDPGSFSNIYDELGRVQDILSNGLQTDIALEGSKEGGVITLTGILPIRWQGETIGFISVEKSTVLINKAALDYISSAGLASLVITAGFVLIFILLNRKAVIQPIQTITHAANTFVENKAELSRELENVHTHDEIEILAQSVLTMEKNIQDYVENIRSITAENERVETELAIASKIQKNLLPSSFPSSNVFDLYASMKPAKEVGGDFYDFFMVDEDHLAFVIADVSGKGVPAALFMVTAKTLLKAHTQFSQEEGTVFMDVNNILCENNEEGLFVTCWMGILELSTGLLRFVNAGHNPPAIFQDREKFTYLKGKRGLILAAMEDMYYQVNEIRLYPGDRLFLYTDGVTEAHNAAQELYGEDRLLKILDETRSLGVREVLHTIEKSIDDFAGDKEQFDDITMLMIEMKSEDTNR